MRSLIAAMKVSIDLKVAGPDGFADWVDGWSEDYELTRQIDACLLGGGMFPGYEQYWTAIQNEPTKPLPMTERLPTPDEVKWAEAIPRLPHYVVSTTLTASSWSNVRFIRSFDEVAALKAEPGKDIYVMGGRRFTTALIDAGLVNELRLIVYPLIAGGDNTLFSTIESRKAVDVQDVERISGGRLKLTYQLT